MKPSLLEVLQPTWVPIVFNARKVEGEKERLDSLGRPNTGRPLGAKDKAKRKGKA